MTQESLSSREALREGGSILKDAILNQYQAIVAAGVGAVSLLAMNPLPLLIWLGAELVLLPLIDSPPVRRMVQRKRMERARGEFAVWRTRAVESLHPEQLARFRQMEGLCRQIETNYLGLHGMSQIYLGEQREKLDQILNSCLHRMLALAGYEKTLSTKSPESLQKEILRLEQDLKQPALIARARTALEKNIELKRTLLKALREAKGTHQALGTELDSMQSLLEVLLQKSLSMRDPEAISAELDAIVRQSEDSERTVREMESLMRSSGEEFGVSQAELMAYPGVAPRTGASAAPPPPAGRVKNRP